MFNLTEEQRLIRGTTSEFPHAQFAPNAAALDEHCLFPKQAVKQMAEPGLLGMVTAPGFDGSGHVAGLPVEHISLQSPLELPCGAVLKNRLAKSPMSDSLANGEGNPTEEQIRLYERWAEGGAAVSFIGEVQGDPRFPEKPGNLVLGAHTNQKAIQSLTSRAMIKSAHLWPQIGHAGALSHLPISQPKGPSALDLEGLKCAGMSIEEIQELPNLYARTALHAKKAGFSGVQIHAGHGFLLSQFLSPLFNLRNDSYGGSLEARCHIVLKIISEVRRAVGSAFPVGIRINATDKLEGGLTEADALEVVGLLDQTSIDLIDISGGTYFPGAKASSDGSSQGPYFLDFAGRAKKLTKVPLMATGGFKRREQALDAVASGAVDMVGIGRAMALNPRLAEGWLTNEGRDPEFPRFDCNPTGGVTAWFTMRLTALGEDRENAFTLDLPTAIHEYEKRDAQRCITWQKKFSHLYT
ncbi:MAG: acyl-CoA dehydrogenase family protein [Arenicellales bacterium WSBS_2016_MAG_OTU3]